MFSFHSTSHHASSAVGLSIPCKYLGSLELVDTGEVGEAALVPSGGELGDDVPWEPWGGTYNHHAKKNKMVDRHLKIIEIPIMYLQESTTC